MGEGGRGYVLALYGIVYGSLCPSETHFPPYPSLIYTATLFKRLSMQVKLKPVNEGIITNPQKLPSNHSAYSCLSDLPSGKRNTVFRIFAPSLPSHNKYFKILHGLHLQPCYKFTDTFTAIMHYYSNIANIRVLYSISLKILVNHGFILLKKKT